MRYGGLCGLGLLTALGGTLHADWKITTVTTSAAGQSIQTEYFKGELKRSDFRDGLNGPLRSAGIFDFHNLRYTTWDEKTRQYTVQRQQRGHVGVPGPAITIDIETADTGERRTMFGRTARRLTIVERCHTAGGPGIADSQSESRTDGWYIDTDALPEEKRGGLVHVLSTGGQRPVVKVNRKGPAATGLAVLLRRTSIRTMPNGQRSNRELTVEVTELVEGQLDKALFEPPPGFQRVISLSGAYPLPWRDKMQLRWEWLQDWISSLFA